MKQWLHNVHIACCPFSVEMALSHTYIKVYSETVLGSCCPRQFTPLTLNSHIRSAQWYKTFGIPLPSETSESFAVVIQRQ